MRTQKQKRYNSLRVCHPRQEECQKEPPPYQTTRRIQEQRKLRALIELELT